MLVRYLVTPFSYEHKHQKLTQRQRRKHGTDTIPSNDHEELRAKRIGASRVVMQDRNELKCHPGHVPHSCNGHTFI